jgi:hypothetical protein
MEKDIDRIAKNQETDIVIRIDDFGGKRGLTIREFVRSDRYSGFTKAGTRIPADKFKQFKAAINMVDEKDLESQAGDAPATPYKPAQSKQSSFDSSSSYSKKPASKKIDEIDEQEF